MAWLAVDKDGKELCSNVRLFRYHEAIKKLIEQFNYTHHREYLNNDNHWCDNFCDSFINGYYAFPRFTGVILPQGSIKKLIGRELTWSDEPVEI